MVIARWSNKSFFVLGAVCIARMWQQISLLALTTLMASRYGLAFNMFVSTPSPSTCRFKRNIFASVTGYRLKCFLPTEKSCGLSMMTSTRL